MDDTERFRAWMDKLEIRELIERGMRCIDDGDAEGLAELFEDDGIMQLSGTVFDRDAIRTTMGMRRTAPPWTEPGALLRQPRGTHLSSNPVIDVDGDTATAETDMIALGRGEDGRAKITLVARYRDRWRRGADGRWRITTRTGVSIARPGEAGTDAEWSRALAELPEDVRSKFRLE